MIQIRPLSQKALTCWDPAGVWQGWRHCGRRSHSDTGPLHSFHNVHILMYKYTHSLPFICPARRERWELFLRVRRDRTGLMLWHSVCISCFFRFIFKKHVTAIWKAQRNYEMKHSNYIYQGLFPIRMQHTLPKCSVYPRASIGMTHSQWATPHRAVTQQRLVMRPRVGLWF